MASSNFEQSYRTEVNDENVPTEIKRMLAKLIDSEGNFDMRNVTSIIWINRHHRDMVSTIVEQLIANSNERTVFNGVEFYLPQLAHMIIHLDSDSACRALEYFCLVICQQSLHVALQLNWILTAALEDYQPELPDGNANPKANALYFQRCIRLLHNVEMVVSIGNSRNGIFLEEPVKEWDMIKMKLDVAQSVMTYSSQHPQDDKLPRGYLWHKQWTHKKGFHEHKWIRRWFSLEDRVLYCYREPSPSNFLNCFGVCSKRSTLKRAIVLNHAFISSDSKSYKDGKYEYYFTITSPMGNWRLRAESELKFQVWVEALKKVSAAPPELSITKKVSDSLFNDIEASSVERDSDKFKRMESLQFQVLRQEFQGDQEINLNQSQIGRYQFFTAEKEFVKNLTDICEELRFVPNRDDRAPLLKTRLRELSIPAVSYLPLVKSTDKFQLILNIIANESRPFSTKARCPALVTFETALQWLNSADENSPLDVANFLHWTYIDTEQRSISRQEQSSAALYGSKMMEPDELKINQTYSESSSREGSGSNNELFSSGERRNIWRKGKAQVMKHPEFFSPFKMKSFRTPNFNLSSCVKIFASMQVTKHISKRWMSKAAVREHAISTETGNNSVNAWPDVEGIDNSIDDFNLSDRKEKVHDIKEATFDVTSLSVDCTQHYGSIDNNTTESFSGPRSIKSSLTKQCEEMQNIKFRASQMICQGESLEMKVERLKNQSSNSSTKGWGIKRVILKSNDDLRQEVFIMQMINFYLEVFRKEKLDLWLQPYQILSTSKSTGLIQVLDDSNSIAGVKKGVNYPGSLRKIFEMIFGAPGTRNFEMAQLRFAQSLAGYSVVSYLLAFKDRHNGNVMLTTEGRLIHIDFGFVFGQAPGGKFSMERAPFKLTNEYVDVLGGRESRIFKYYTDLVWKGLSAARRYAHISLTLIEIMSFRSEFPCFSNQPNVRKALKGFKSRLMWDLSEDEVKKEAKKLVSRSLNHIGTTFYDKFQLYSNGIPP